jgi:hypothetical protein
MKGINATLDPDSAGPAVAEGRHASEGDLARAILRKRIQEGLDQALQGDLHDADERCSTPWSVGPPFEP